MSVCVVDMWMCKCVLWADSDLGQLVEPMVWHYLTTFQLPFGEVLHLAPDPAIDLTCVTLCITLLLYRK